jgi:hypothetical protein
VGPGKSVQRPTVVEALEGVGAGLPSTGCLMRGDARAAVGILFAALAALGACAGNQRLSSNHTSGAGLPLLPPESLGESRQISQLLRADYGDSFISLRCVVIIDAKALKIIGLTSYGLRAFTLSYDGQRLRESRSAQFPKALGSRQLLNDLQLVYWPLATLQQAWSNAGVVVRAPTAEQRHLVRGEQLLAEVHYPGDVWNGTVVLRHFDQPYTITIDSSPLPAESP